MPVLAGGADVEFLRESDGRLRGRFLLGAGPDTRVPVTQRLIAVSLAVQVGVASSPEIRSWRVSGPRIVADYCYKIGQGR